MNVQFHVLPTPSPRETAEFIFRSVREDIGSVPAWATPKYPLPAIMHTERQVALLDAALAEAGMTRAMLGVKEGELEDLVLQAQVLRGRYLLRQLRRREDVCNALHQLDALIAAAPRLVKDLRIPTALLEENMLACAV